MLMRGYYVSAMCNSRILMASEVMKFAICLLPLCAHGELYLLTRKMHLALVPVVGYAFMNLMSFWALQRLPAAVAIVIVQLKLLWAACFARLFVRRPLLNKKSFALVAITLGSVATVAHAHESDLSLDRCRYPEASYPEAGSAALAQSAVHATSLVAACVLLAESMLSGFMSVYMQIIFENGENLMWQRNAQIACLSIAFYYLTEGFMPGSDSQACRLGATYVPDTAGWAIAAMNGVGGLLVAFSILYSGAVGKTVATSAAIPLTALSESIFIAHALPSLVQTMLVATVLNAVLMFMMF